MPACGPPSPNSHPKPPLPTILIRSPGKRGCGVVAFSLLPPVHSSLSWSSSVPWEADLHELPHPLASSKDQKLGVGGEGEFRAHLPHSACLGAAFCAPLSLGPRLPRLACPSVYINPRTELSSLVHPSGTAGPAGCCRMQAGILPTAALCWHWAGPRASPGPLETPNGLSGVCDFQRGALRLRVGQEIGWGTWQGRGGVGT